MVKIPHPNIPMQTGKRRPMISDMGAQAMGPAANPRTNNVTPSVAASLPIPNSSLTDPIAAENTALVNELANVLYERIQTRKILDNISKSPTRIPGPNEPSQKCPVIRV
jgi:hypothetical protein